VALGSWVAVKRKGLPKGDQVLTTNHPFIKKKISPLLVFCYDSAIGEVLLNIFVFCSCFSSI
jgi:hypothetical protein